jgi:hypothetical protein
VKYFTPELYIRGNSPDDDVVDGVEEEWERAIRRYDRRWRKIKTAFPAGVRRFDEVNLCLHDAKLLHMAQDGNRLIMVLEQEPPARDLVILTFTLLAPPVIDTDVLPNRVRGQAPYWLYEEFDLDRQKRCCFEVFFSNGWLVKVIFRDFHFLVAKPVVPEANGLAGGHIRADTPAGAS